MEGSANAERQTVGHEPTGVRSDSGAAWEDTPDYARFKQCVHQKSGIDLNLYKPQQMYRRLHGMLDRAGVTSFADYFALMERNPQEYATFLDRMTINVSELFRNPEKWEELRTRLLPGLASSGGQSGPGHGSKGFKVWSAGCSYGAEPYTLAILLDQMFPAMTHTIHATDLDRTILAKAREGRFTLADVKNVAPELLSRYFSRLSSSAANLPPDLDACFQVYANIRSRVTFQAHNLLADRFDTGYDLICCRNVVIYFTDDAKERLYARFRQALKPGGVLFVGGTERIFNFRELGFETSLPFFYQRDDAASVSPSIGRK
jgi:chemotaxis protein methyltransferase CheR